MSLPPLLQRNRQTLEMAVCYLLYSSLLPAGKALKPYVGEAADVLQLASLLWPGPVFFALQSWPLAQDLWPLIIVAGLFVVIGFGWLITNRFPNFAQTKRWSHISSVVLWYVPIFLLQVFLLLMVWALGYPLGE